MTTGLDEIEADEDALMRAAERMQGGVARFREFPPEDLTRIIRQALRWRSAALRYHDELMALGQASMAIDPHEPERRERRWE